MAAATERITSIIGQARIRRVDLSRYLRLDGARYLLGLVLVFCLMSLILLVQTSMVAARGYALADVRTARTELLRERSQLQEQLARAQSLDRVLSRAAELGFRPITADQVRYVRIPALLDLAREE